MSRSTICAISMAVTFSFLLPAAADAAGATFYVTMDGNDSWTGARPQATGSDGPFRTLERARDAIRQWRQSGVLPHGGVTVQMAPDSYCLDKPFDLTAIDSGTALLLQRTPDGGRIASMVDGRRLSIGDPEVFTSGDPIPATYIELPTRSL